MTTTLVFTLNQVFFHNFHQIRRIEQKEIWQKWGLSPGYAYHFPTVLTFTSQSQLRFQLHLLHAPLVLPNLSNSSNWTKIF